MTDCDFQTEMDAAYEEWLSGLTDDTFPQKAREAMQRGDEQVATRELAIVFLAEQFEEALVDSHDYSSTPEVQADGSVKLLWKKTVNEDQ